MLWPFDYHLFYSGWDFIISFVLSSLDLIKSFAGHKNRWRRTTNLLKPDFDTGEVELAKTDNPLEMDMQLFKSTDIKCTNPALTSEFVTETLNVKGE